MLRDDSRRHETVACPPPTKLRPIVGMMHHSDFASPRHSWEAYYIAPYLDLGCPALLMTTESACLEEKADQRSFFRLHIRQSLLR
jgi:hypothetical protein